MAKFHSGVRFFDARVFVPAVQYHVRRTLFFFHACPFRRFCVVRKYGDFRPDAFLLLRLPFTRVVRAEEQTWRRNAGHSGIVDGKRTAVSPFQRRILVFGIHVPVEMPINRNNTAIDVRSDLAVSVFRTSSNSFSDRVKRTRYYNSRWWWFRRKQRSAART